MSYTRNILALVGFFLVALVLLVTLQEFWRAAWARMRSQGGNLITALWTLIAHNRRRYGGYVIHISMMLMAVGILGIGFMQLETQGTLPVNGSLKLGDYKVTFQSISQFPFGDDRQVTRAVLGVYSPDGKYLGELHPRIDTYASAQQNATIPGERATLRDDLYVLLIDWQPAAASGATFKVLVNPLINWLWIGALVFLVGIFIAAWPEGDPESVIPRIQSSGQVGQRKTNRVA